MVGNPHAARAHGTNKRMRETILAGKPADPLKQLKVKASVCVRMSKEVAYYQKEAGENETRVQGMKDEGKDIYDIKKAEEVLQESYMMIPDSKNRFQKSLEDLLDHVREFATDAALVGTDDLAKAQTILSENDMGDEDGGEAAEEAGAGEEYAEGEIF
mmetsp:Transcript_17775/g.41670  ORF Transcript_17775/g.41670 Transcript_17775/m.41670 type:complete len:158 (-) Transcript_17775:443-916(-)